MSKGVYVVDPTLASAVAASTFLEVPFEVLQRMPEHCVYVAAEWDTQSFVMGRVLGFFAHLTLIGDEPRLLIQLDTERGLVSASVTRATDGSITGLDGAKRKLEHALAIFAKVFGTEDHPDVAASLHALAGVLRAQGDLDGAKKKLEHALAIFAKVFGTEDHPDVAASLHALAGVLQDQGDLDGAIVLLERVLQIDRRAYRSRDHYSTSITEVGLAQLLATQGHRERAVALLQHALAVFTRQLPPGHNLTRQTQQILAAVMGAAPSQELPGQNAAPYVLHTLGARRR